MTATLRRWAGLQKPAKEKSRLGKFWIKSCGKYRRQRFDPPGNLLRQMWRLQRHHLLMLTGRLVLSNLLSFHFLYFLSCSVLFAAVLAFFCLLTPHQSRNGRIEAKPEHICSFSCHAFIKSFTFCLFKGWLLTSNKSVFTDSESPDLSLNAGPAAR